MSAIDLSCVLVENGAARTIPYCFPIGREWWLQLFSGTVGAIIGAIVAALAAVWVLNRTNAKQQELWEASSEMQRIRDNHAQEDQRARDEELRRDAQEALNRQLAAQQDALDRSIENQLEQASHARQTAAASSLTGHLVSMNHAIGKDSALILENRNNALHAATVWYVELYGKHEKFRQALSRGLPLSAFDAIALDRLRQAHADEVDPVRAEKIQDFSRREALAIGRALGRYISLYSQWLALPESRAQLEKKLIGVPLGESFRRIEQSGFVDLRDLVYAMDRVEEILDEGDSGE